MPLGWAAQCPFYIITQEPTQGKIPEAEPAFSFHTSPVNGAAASRPGQHNLPIKQRDHIPRRGGADNKSGARPGDQGGAKFGTTKKVIVIQVGGDSFRGYGDCVDSRVVGVQNRFGVNLVKNHNGKVVLY